MYVGGFFTDAGGVSSASRIARWDGSQWHALGGGVNGPIYAIAVSGTSTYVGGEFTDAGGNPYADFVAVARVAPETPATKRVHLPLIMR